MTLNQNSPVKKLSRTVRFCAAAIMLLSGATLRATIPIPSESEYVVSLNGKWRFKLEQAPPPPRFLGVKGQPIPVMCPTNFESFFSTDYREDSAWHDISVPGNWEMAGFSPATYNEPDNASGFYRLRFQVPAKWQGRGVRINFDGVQNGCEIWCNGRPVAVDEASWGRANYHESGWTAWQADLTPAIKFGQENLLALRVTKNTRSVGCDTGDFFLLGGVHRPVTLFSIPQNHVHDFGIRTALRGEDKAEVTVLAQVSNAGKGNKMVVNLEGQPPIEAETDANGRVTLTQVVSHPKLWSAEFPNLYSIAFELKDADGKTIERIERKTGIREISTKNGIFRVNDVPVKLVGICRHDVYPTLGTAIGPEVWKKDLTLMKAANFNAVRTSHYPYGSGFYDLCDEMGFYVLDEEPFCWVDCDNPKDRPAFEQRVRETIARDKNHPCVVIWGVGNENKLGRNNILAAKITHELDPTRPRLISCREAVEGGSETDFDDKHYITPQRVHAAEKDPRRATWPQIYTENPNVWDVRNGPDYGSLDLWAPVITRTWNEIWNDDHVCGTFLWEWQDRAVADKCPTKYYDVSPETGINLVKVKGVVDGFRNPRPEYFHIKMGQSPIVVGEKFVKEPGGVKLQITNHYSFTDLSSISARWSLSAEHHLIAGGTTSLSLAPRSGGSVSLSLPSPAKLDVADTLQLEFEHPGGWNVATYQFPLKPITHPAPSVRPVRDIMFPKFNLITGTRTRNRSDWWQLDRTSGDLANIKVQRAATSPTPIEQSALLSTPLKEIATLDADVVLQPGALPAGRLHADIENSKMSYRFTWTKAKSDIYELGWTFSAPKGCDHFSWSRQALWSWYPPEHVGRPTGTATPDSAHVDLTRVDRPDAFDFDSTKFNCDWASLADGSGKGLCVLFSAEQRQHVRGGFGADGNCTLIVNRCYSPPRDISSTLVEDLYTVMNKNDEIRGSFEIPGIKAIASR